MSEISKLNGYDIKDATSRESISTLSGNIDTLNLSKIQTYNTVSDMKNDTDLIAGIQVKTKGYYSIGDGGASYYHITDTESNTDYQEELTNGLYATLIVIDSVYPEQAGAYGDGIHDDTTIITNLLSYYDLSFYSDKNYLISNVITIDSDKYINGNNCSFTIGNSKTLFNITGNNNILENFKIYKSSANYYGINIENNANNNKIFNVSGFELTYSLIMNNGQNSIIENCYAYMCGWDCVSNYQNSKNAIVKNCRAIKCGRHGFSCDVGCENLTIEDCYAENIGFITGEGHSSFHIEGGKECTIRNCQAVYNANHLKFSETFTGILTACRIEGTYNNYIDGLKVDISGSFASTDLFPLYFDSTSDPNIYINNLCINNTNSNLLNIYLSRSYLYITNSIFNGLSRFRQVGTNGIIKKLDNCKINIGSTDNDYMFYQARYKADGFVATNNVITNSKSLVEGRVINSIIKNNVFSSCGASVFLTQAESDSSQKSNNVTFSNNIIDGCTTGIEIGWSGNDENIFIFDNLFKGTMTTVLLGHYITAHVFDNKQQNLTYTTLKTNVTISSADDSLDFA